MFMPFDRQHHTARQTRFTPMADATGTPSTARHSTDHSRQNTSDARDFREQADGAP